MKEKPCFISPFWGGFLSDRIPRRRRRSMFIILFTVFRDELAMNNTMADKIFCKVNNEFREIFEDTTHKILKEMVRGRSFQR